MRNRPSVEQREDPGLPSPPQRLPPHGFLHPLKILGVAHLLLILDAECLADQFFGHVISFFEEILGTGYLFDGVFAEIKVILFDAVQGGQLFRDVGDGVVVEVQLFETDTSADVGGNTFYAITRCIQYLQLTKIANVLNQAPNPIGTDIEETQIFQRTYPLRAR